MTRLTLAILAALAIATPTFAQTVQWAPGVDMRASSIPAAPTDATPDVSVFAPAQSMQVGKVGGVKAGGQVSADPALGGDVTDAPPTAPVDVIITPAQMQPAFAQYQVQPPLDRVYEGDSPDAPTMTVELQFPDLATAQAVLAGLWTAPAAPPGN